ncbi:DUF4136 domain-containing protein [Cecembia sp.]|uniref:DUF4136 domain-containing protein n=1 Tax=Cecembia sp. TaxID=1898110 RepID=UPI0025BE757E|nr:DUF4136 domain-containing protein [Cecembia sp.]
MKSLSKKLPLLCMIAYSLSSCSTIEVFKEKTEFRPYKEYQSFVILNREVGFKGFNDEFLDALVSDGLHQLFEEQGLVYERENPDLVIRYTSNEDLREKEVMNNMYPMWGWRVWDPFLFDPRFNNNRGMYSTKNYELMQLIVDFIDTKNDKMLMQLTAVSEIHNPNDKKRKVRKSVEKVAETYMGHIQNSKP